VWCAAGCRIRWGVQDMLPLGMDMASKWSVRGRTSWGKLVWFLGCLVGGGGSWGTLHPWGWTQQVYVK
jgi:hypothetical protein